MREASGGGALAIRSRINSAWNEWEQLGGNMMHRNIPLSVKVRVYKAELYQTSIFVSLKCGQCRLKL